MFVDNHLHCELSRFCGPGLVVYNNSLFKDEDWINIQHLQHSRKANNLHQVGKFGIGFNSAYHITGEYIYSSWASLKKL